VAIPVDDAFFVFALITLAAGWYHHHLAVGILAILAGLIQSGNQHDELFVVTSCKRW
jgi:hypothetical protein